MHGWSEAVRGSAREALLCYLKICGEGFTSDTSNSKMLGIRVGHNDMHFMAYLDPLRFWKKSKRRISETSVPIPVEHLFKVTRVISGELVSLCTSSTGNAASMSTRS